MKIVQIILNVLKLKKMKNKLSSRGVFDLLVLMVGSSELERLQDRFSRFSFHHAYVYDIDVCPGELFLDFLSWYYLTNEVKNV